MGLRIGSDALLGLTRNLGLNDVLLQAAFGQLASGLRINSAADGPAALTVSEQLRATIASQGTLIDNTQRAVDLVQTAEGGLTEINAQLNELRGLAIEAANTGVNDPTALQALQQQVEAGIEAINRIAGDTTFGTQNLLNGDLQGEQFQVDGGPPLTLSIPDLRAEALGTGVDTTSGFDSLAAIDVTTEQGAVDALAVIDAAQAQVTGARADLGAFQQNVLETNVRALQVARENLLLADSTIRDAVFSEVTTRTSVLSVLLQAGVGLQGLLAEERSGLFLNLLA